MTFITSALSNPQLTAIRTNGYSSRQYILFAPNTVVFQARVNQASFTDSFVSVDFDTVTTGAYTDIKEGYTVYIGATSDIRSATFIGYARRDDADVVATATSININQTSANLADNWYITVTKDVRLWYKLPRWIDSSTYYKDWSITFRRVRPLITGIQTAYVKVLSGGVADFAFTPSASAVDKDATSSFTWAWDADGGTFQSGTSSSQNVTLRYSTAGHYMPRLTVTDSNGVSNWLTCHVFVVSSTYASIVEVGADGASIDCDIDTGNNATIRFFEGVDAIPDYTFCAIWSPNNLSTAYTSDIVFVGRLRNEQMSADLDPVAMYTPSTSFQVEGFGAELARLFNAGKIALENVASPTRFDEIKKLTPLRGLGYYLSEHTTLTNIASLTLDDLADTYLMQTYAVDQASVLEQCKRLLEATNRVFEWARTGEIMTARKAVYMSSAERNALTTIAEITLRDMQVDASGGVIYNVSADMVNTVGRLTAFGGAYSEALDKYQPYQAIVPAVAPTDGDDSGMLNGQILTANTIGFVELGERCANAFAEAQPPVIITVSLLPSYYGLIPSVNKWYTFDIPATTNNRGVTYSSSDRWYLQSVSIQHDNATGFPNVTGIFRLETVGGDYKSIVRIPPDATEYTNPIMPIDSVYPSLPADPTAPYADLDNLTPDDMPPFTPIDIADTSRPTQPGTNQTQLETGLTGMAWADGSIYYITNLGTVASFSDVTPTTLDGLTIQDGKLSRHDNKAYVLASDEDETSKFFKTNAFGSIDYARTDLVGDYRLIRMTSSAGALYLLSNANNTWEHTFDFEQAEYADYFTIDPAPTSIQDPVYTSGVGYENGIHAPGDGYRYNSSRIVTDTFADTYITQFELFYEITAPTLGALDSTSFQYRTGLNGSFSGITTIGLGTSPIASSQTVNVNLTRDYFLFQVNGARRLGANSPNGNAIISKVIFRGTGVNPFGGASAYNTRYSTDNGATFASPVSPTSTPSANGGFDAQFIGSTVWVSASAKVQQATSGGAYSDTTGGGTTGTYPQCIVSYGTGSSFVMATPASVSGESMWKVVGGSATAITPNDGTSDGLSVSPNCIAMAGEVETHIVAVLSFGGVRKVAYTTNGGSSWSFNTQVSNSANYVRMIRIGTLYYIAICDGNVIWWGVWSGSGTLTFYSKVAPQTINGFEFK